MTGDDDFNPFNRPQARVRTAHELDTAAGEAEWEQALAEVRQVCRHSRAFTLFAIDEDGQNIVLTVGNGATLEQMATLLGGAVEQYQTSLAELLIGAIMSGQVTLPMIQEILEEDDDD